MLAPIQLNIISLLSRYKYLSRLQLARLGVISYSSSLSRSCAPLVKGNYIGFIDATNYGIGYIYYLKKKAAILLSNEREIKLEHIKYCLKRPKLSIQTLHHRTNAINCQIELELACLLDQTQLLFYHRDIDSSEVNKIGDTLMRKTRIECSNNTIIEPDAIFMIDTKKGKKLYCLEYEHRDYTKKSVKKLRKHLIALNERALSSKYKHSKAHRCLFIYYNEGTMKSVMQKIGKETQKLNNWFLFKSYDEFIPNYSFKQGRFRMITKTQIMSNWLNVAGEKVDMY